MNLRNQIEALRQYYNSLSRWGKWFFPRELAQLLSTNNATCVDVVNAAFSSTWFYHRWFFSGLSQFFNNPLIKNSRKLFTLKSDRQWLHQHADDNALQLVLKLNQNEPITPSLYRQHMSLLKNKSPHVWSVLGFLGSIPSQPFPNRHELGIYIERLSNSVNLAQIGSLSDFMAKLPPELRLFDSRNVVINLLNHDQPATLRACLDILSRESALTAPTMQHLASLGDLHPLLRLLRTHPIAAEERHESRGQRLQRIVREQQPRAATNNNQSNYLGADNQTHRRNDAPDESTLNHMLTLLLEAKIQITDEMHELITNHANFGDLYNGALYFQINNVLNSENFNSILNARNIQLTVNGILPMGRFETAAKQREEDLLRAASRTSLRKIVEHSESSMEALTPAEIGTFNKVKDHYKTTSYSFDTVLDDLAARYHQNPARLIRPSQAPLVLPLEWNALQNLHLRGDDYQKALKMYYKNEVHTVWRYLKPGANPWSYQPNSHAPYQDNNQQAFENLVALLWVAVCDTSQPPAPGQGSISDRIDLFIKEIEGMARAHNHDNDQALLTDANGDPLLVVNPANPKGPKIERRGKFDDLRPDHPSCSYGLNTRLFQSILAHPLFQDRLPPIEAEFIDALHDHFRDEFDQLPVNQLIYIRDIIGDFAFIEGIKEEEEKAAQKKTLQDLNMKAEKASSFRTYLEDKYTMYRASDDMQATVNGFINEAYQVITFTNAANVFELLNNAIAAKQPSSLSTTGMFGCNPGANQEQPLHLEQDRLSAPQQ